jgi:signal peptidase I
MRLKFWRKPTPSDQENQKKKSKTREWIDSILFAVVAATIIRWLVMSAYTIPTPSMEGSQLVGDFLFVSKFHYGARTPNTLLHLPLTHNTIWGTNIPSYLSWLQLPTYRLPGFSQVNRNDVVVFNLPSDTIARPVDMRTNYVKRCVAIAGDTLEVRNTNLYINHKRAVDPEKLQYRYELITSIPVSDRVFGRYNVYFGGENSNLRYTGSNGQYAYYIYITPANVSKLKAQLSTTLLSLKMLKQEKDVASAEMYPSSYWRDQNKKKGTAYAVSDIRWSVDYFGPLVIPK